MFVTNYYYYKANSPVCNNLEVPLFCKPWQATRNEKDFETFKILYNLPTVFSASHILCSMRSAFSKSYIEVEMARVAIDSFSG